MKPLEIIFLIVTIILLLSEGYLRASEYPVAADIKLCHAAIVLPYNVKLESAMKWYGEALRLKKAWDIKEADMNNESASVLPRRLFGDGYRKVRYVQMISENKALAIELFELENSEPDPVRKATIRRGYVHIAVTVKDPALLSESIVRTGGEEIWRTPPEHKKKIIFLKDPYGNIIELFTASSDDSLLKKPVEK